MENFEGWSVEDETGQARRRVGRCKAIHSGEKEISDEALAELVSRVGPHPRQLDSEIEKLSLYVGERRGKSNLRT